MVFCYSSLNRLRYKASNNMIINGIDCESHNYYTIKPTKRKVNFFLSWIPKIVFATPMPHDTKGSEIEVMVKRKQ